MQWILLASCCHFPPKAHIQIRAAGEQEALSTVKKSRLCCYQDYNNISRLTDYQSTEPKFKSDENALKAYAEAKLKYS